MGELEDVASTLIFLIAAAEFAVGIAFLRLPMQ
jgi:hypothetical protein